MPFPYIGNIQGGEFQGGDGRISWAQASVDLPGRKCWL